DAEAVQALRAGRLDLRQLSLRLLPGMDLFCDAPGEVPVAGQHVGAQLEVLVLQDAGDERLDRHAQRLALQQQLRLVRGGGRGLGTALAVAAAPSRAGAPFLDQPELE